MAMRFCFGRFEQEPQFAFIDIAVFDIGRFAVRFLGVSRRYSEKNATTAQKKVMRDAGARVMR